jgi:hypothetical protein
VQLLLLLLPLLLLLLPLLPARCALLTWPFPNTSPPTLEGAVAPPR